MTSFKHSMRHILPFIRPLRPPNLADLSQNPRLFTSKAPHLNISRPSARPQLPFLSGSFYQNPSLTARLISTRSINSFKYQLKLLVYYTLIGTTLLIGGTISFHFFRQNWLDHLHPSPEEWYTLTKFFWRTAKHEEETEGNGTGVIDWAGVGSNYRNVVASLEDYTFLVHRPTGLIQLDDYDHSLPVDPDYIRTLPDLTRGVQLYKSRIGFDITMKSTDWRNGYYEAMIGFCKAAEMRNGYFMYKGKTFPPEYVRSEENPYPKPLPPGVNVPNPDKADCEPPLEDPDYLYIKLLTTKGFTRKQRMHAAISYALWLDHSGNPDAAQKYYHWSLALACQGLSVKAEAVVNPETGVINSSSPYITSNVLTTTTALASHHARHGNISTALGIYLSILRARRAAEEAPEASQYTPRHTDYSLTNPESILKWISHIPFPPQYPQPSTTGDEPFQRTQAAACEEAAIMAYVGEILFAKTSRRREGLSWTRDATAVAERGHEDKRLAPNERKVCSQCVKTGLYNWRSMAKLLSTEKDEKESAPDGWFRSGKAEAWVRDADWKVETKQISDRISRYEDQMLRQRLNAHISGKSSWFVA